MAIRPYPERASGGILARMRRLVALAFVLPLIAAQAPVDAPRTEPTEPLVPVTRMDSPLIGVRTADLHWVITTDATAGTLSELLPDTHVLGVADPIQRVRATGEVALVPASLVSIAVKTLELDGRFIWRDPDVAHWPLRVAASERSDAVADTWTVLAAGEIIFGRGVQERIENGFAGNARAAFTEVRDALRTADLTLATLEAPLSGNANRYCDSCMTFVGDERYAPAVADAGIDVVSLAANHIGDAGPQGILDTIRALDRAGIAHTGAGANAEAARRSVVTTAAGHRVAVLAYDGVSGPWYGATPSAAGSNPLWYDDPTFARVRMDVARASLDADEVIVLAHWGVEYEDHPRPEVVAAAYAMIEAGATAVIGDHPHWVQSVERYRGAYVAYGVGNFVFDQMWSEETREGSIHELSFWGDRLVSVRIMPTIIEDWYRPRFLTPDEPAYRTVMQRIWSHSLP